MFLFIAGVAVDEYFAYRFHSNPFSGFEMILKATSTGETLP